MSEIEKQPAPQLEKINITDIDVNEAQKINDQFSNRPKETIKKLKEVINGIDEIGKEGLVLKIIEGINTCNTDAGNDFDTIGNINNFLILLENLKSLDPNIDKNETEGTPNAYNTLKTTLEAKKTTLEQEKKQNQLQETTEKKATDILKSAPTLELATQLFGDNTDRLITNLILEKFSNNTLSDTEKDNLATMITLYVQKIDKDIEITKDNLSPMIKKGAGEGAKHRPENYNGLSVYLVRIPYGTPVKYIEIFPGTENDIHKARSEALKEKNFKTGDNNEIDLTQLGQKDGPSLKDFIDQAHEQGSYEAFSNIIKNNPIIKQYIIKNIGTVLNDIQEKHKGIDKGKIKSVSPEHTNGYYRIIAETIVSTGDKGTIKAYLSHIQITPSYLGDGQSRIDTRNIVAKRGEANILKSPDPADKELQNLYLLAKSQIDPTKAKGDILEQVDENLDKFMETFGPAIAMVIDFLGGKGTFMKMLPSAMREKFKENFKKNSEMKGKELERFEVISNAFEKSPISKNKIEKPDEKIIEDVQSGEESENIGKTLNENFTSLSPSLVYKIVKEYNKNKKPEEQIKPEDVITFNAKGVPESVKNNASDNHKKIIITQLLDKTSPMWKDIKGAYKHVLANSKTDLRTDTEIEKGTGGDKREDINGSETDKGIGSYADVAIYIAAYVSTAGGNTPYHHVISENDRIVTNKSHKDKAVEGVAETETPKTKEELHIGDITNLNDLISSGKYTNDKKESLDFPYDYNGTNHIQYQTNVMQPLSMMLSINKLTGENTNFAETTKNIDKFVALKSKPQVLKDLITYTANKPENKDKKTDIDKIAANVTAIKEIKKQDDGNLLVQIDDTKKFTINPGPIFLPTA